MKRDGNNEVAMGDIAYARLGPVRAYKVSPNVRQGERYGRSEEPQCFKSLIFV